MKPSLVSLVTLPGKIAYAATYFGGLYENPDGCEYTDEYDDGFGCPDLASDVCCFKEDSLYGSGDVTREGTGSSFTVTLGSKRGDEYCEVFLGNDPKCVTGGSLQVAGGVFYTFNNELTMEETKDQAVKKPRKHQEAELALFGPDYAYTISNAKLAELEAQGNGKPEDKQARIEWFKKHYTTRVSRPGNKQPASGQAQEAQSSDTNKPNN